MLSLQEKIEILEEELYKTSENYADSFKTDVSFYIDDFNIKNEKLSFLNNVESKAEIIKWVDRLISNIIMKFNSEEENLSDFIHYYNN